MGVESINTFCRMKNSVSWNRNVCIAAETELKVKACCLIELNVTLWLCELIASNRGLRRKYMENKQIQLSVSVPLKYVCLGFFVAWCSWIHRISGINFIYCYQREEYEQRIMGEKYTEQRKYILKMRKRTMIKSLKQLNSKGMKTT